MRKSDGGNSQTAKINKLGALASNNAYTNMMLEFPLLILASSLNNSYYNNVTNNGQNCTVFYT